MGQRVSVCDEKRKFLNRSIPTRKEVIEIVYDDTDGDEQGYTNKTDQQSTGHDKTAGDLMESALASPGTTQNGTLITRNTDTKSKPFQNSVDLNQVNGHLESTMSISSKPQTKQSIGDLNETLLRRGSSHKSCEVRQNSENWSQRYQAPTSTVEFDSGYPINYPVDEKGEIMEPNFLPSTSERLISPERTTKLASGLQSLERCDSKLDCSSCHSQSQTISETTRQKIKCRNLWQRVRNYRKLHTPEYHLSPDVTLADICSVTGPSENILVHKQLQSCSTTTMGETRQFKLDSQGRAVTFCQSISGKPSPLFDQYQSNPVHETVSPKEGKDFTYKTNGPQLDHLSPGKFDLSGSTQDAQTPSGYSYSKDDHCTLELVHSTSDFTEAVPIQLHRNWRDDPRFSEGFENELLSTVSGQQCTTVTVAAHVPRSCQGSRMKTLTLITLKPDSTTDGDTLSPGGRRERASINLDVTIDRHSADANLVPECLQLMKHSNFVRAQKRFGPLSAETAFVGGNVTIGSKKLARRRKPKSDSSQIPSSMFTSPLSPASLNNIILNHPVHIYTYRFWICCEPWVEQVFKNPMDRRIESIGRLSDCRIRLTRRRRRNAKGFRQQMVSVVAPSADALEKCCKLFDDKFPCFYATAGLILTHDQLVHLSDPFTGLKLGTSMNETRGCFSRPISSCSYQKRKTKAQALIGPHSAYVDGDVMNDPVSISQQMQRKNAKSERFSRFW